MSIGPNKILQSDCDDAGTNAEYMGHTVHEQIICKGTANRIFGHAKISISSSQHWKRITSGLEEQVSANALLYGKVRTTSERVIRSKSLSKRYGRKEGIYSQPWMNTSEGLACTMGPTRGLAFLFSKDLYEPSPETVPSRARRRFSSQNFTGHIHRLNHRTSKLIAEEAQLNKEHVKVP